jgi:curli biogenesis system outer membrane secretion channel CsgG
MWEKIRKIPGGRVLGLPALAAAIFWAASFSGCASVKYSRSEEAKYFKPTIGVATFENRAPLVAKWKVGDDLSDQLTDRLIDTRRYHVLDRSTSGSIARTMSSGRMDRKRRTDAAGAAPDEVRYLVRGTVTDFGAVKTVKEVWPLTNLGVMKEPSHRTVAAMIYVVDVRTGELITSRKVEATYKDDKPQETEYQGIAFGSYAFYHTPLGIATDKVLDQSVLEIAQAIEEQTYQPKISSIKGDQVIINGGKDRRIRIANEYVVRPTPEAIVDPDTGHLLGHVAGDIIGRVRVIQVSERFSVARIVNGDGFQAGQSLFPVQKNGPYQPVAKSSY